MTDTLAGCFERFQRSAQRLETLPRYGVPGEGGLRSLRDNAYLRRVAHAALAGKIWTRVRVVDDPLTGYQREQVHRVFVESHACGEDVLVIERRLVQPDMTDIWVFDAGLPGETVVRLHFDADGVPLPELDETITEPEARDELARHVTELVEIATPLARYLEGPGD